MKVFGALRICSDGGYWTMRDRLRVVGEPVEGVTVTGMV